MKKAGFINYVIKHFFEDGWSLDVCASRSLATGAGNSRIIKQSAPDLCQRHAGFSNASKTVQRALERYL
ncbi:hypothetical protein lhe_0526 [Lactobacillus helveticus CNRZ32]|nr:hypothetical protein lhe_0526 [Lactobacillus helveticus CNRZ32]